MSEEEFDKLLTEHNKIDDEISKAFTENGKTKHYRALEISCYDLLSVMYPGFDD